MLSSNSKPNPQQPRFRLLRICFCPIIRPQNKKIFLPKPIFPAEMLANPPIMLTLRKCKPRKLPHSVGTESQGWKTSPRCGHGISKLESFPTAWARNPKAGKLPHGVGTKSQSWKASPQRGRGIPAINRRGRVCLPECAHNTYVDVFGRANPAPTR